VTFAIGPQLCSKGQPRVLWL